jgi:hypothetical protein
MYMFVKIEAYKNQRTWLHNQPPASCVGYLNELHYHCRFITDKTCNESVMIL